MLSESDSYTCSDCGVDVDGISREEHERRHRRLYSEGVNENKAGDEEYPDFGHGDMSTGHNGVLDKRFFMLERQAGVEQAVLDRAEFRHVDTAAEIRGRTQSAFGQLCVKHNVSHALGNSFLHFAQGKNVVGYLPVLRCPSTIKLYPKTLQHT
jgi:hypothetical protein